MTTSPSTTFASSGHTVAPTLDEVGVRPYVPKRHLSHGHLMTVFAWARRRTFPNLPMPEARLIGVDSHTKVLAHCYWQPRREGCATLIAMHGLEGSSSVHYMRGLADKAYRAGWNAVLLNQRNCGGTEHLTPGLYHSGLTDDPRAVIRSLRESDHLERFSLVGYSLGGNLALKLAGELEEHPHLGVWGVVAICPTLDLECCVRAIERRQNIPYEFNFVRNLRGRMRRKAAAWPGAFDLSRLNRIWTIRAFDDAFTAPSHGFGDAANYYYRASAVRIADRVRVPALMIAAKDDPFVPPEQFSHPAIANNPSIRVSLTAHGGHCGFITEPSTHDDGYWAEMAAIKFLEAVIPG